MTYKHTHIHRNVHAVQNAMLEHIIKLKKKKKKVASNILGSTAMVDGSYIIFGTEIQKEKKKTNKPQEMMLQDVHVLLHVGLCNGFISKVKRVSPVRTSTNVRYCKRIHGIIAPIWGILAIVIDWEKHHQSNKRAYNKKFDTAK